MHFVQMPAELLDQGLGAPLLRLVRRAGATDGQRLAFLCSDPLQQALTVAFEASAASSLPAERAFAETKLSEAPRLCHVATASRNQILRQFLRQRSDVLRQAEVAAAALRKSLNTNMSTLAWELNPALSEVALSKRGGSCAMKAFIAQNSARLHAEVDRRRAMAKSSMQRIDGFETPVTRQAWIHWFRRHQDVFYQEMRESGEKRRAANRRLQASDACPPIGVRLFPPASDETPDRVTEPWMKLLTRRSGWHVVRLVSNELRLLFLFFFERATHCLDCSVWRQGRGFVLQQLLGYVLSEHIQPLAQMEFDEEVAELLEVGINVRFKGLPSTVRLSVVAARTVTAPVLRDIRKRRRNGDPVVDGHDSSGEDSEDLLPDLSSASSCASVDMDVDSAVDDCAEGPAVHQRHDNLVDKIHGRQGAKVIGSIGAHGHGITHVSRVVGDIAAVGSATSSDSDVASDASAVSDEDPEQDKDALEKGFRNPAGTWTIWSGTWFYITKTPGWTDLKVHMKMPFRNVTQGMGTTVMSRTVSPHHYGDDWEDPWRSVLLLRSWSIWRARWQGWAKQKDCRLREVNRQSERLGLKIRSDHLRHMVPLQVPLLGSPQAHALLEKWTLDIAHHLLGDVAAAGRQVL